MIHLKNVKQWFAIACMYLTPTLINANIPHWEIIPSQSELTFTATQNGAPVTGQFKKYTGNIAFDPKYLEQSSAKIVVDILSLAASYSDLTATLLTPDWFNAKAFPQAVFQSSHFSKTGENTYQISGSLTIRDKTIPIKITFTAKESSNDLIQVEGSTALKRGDFGVGQGEWASTKDIKDDVSVNFKLIAKKK